MIATSSTFHEAGQACLVVFVGELAGGGREQEEGQDEDARRQVGPAARAPGAIVVQLGNPPGRVSSTTSAVLEQVVVAQGAEELGQKKGIPEALFAESPVGGA